MFGPEHTRRYEDRREAGIALASRLSHYANRNDVVVLGLPRGGVPVAFEVARVLHAPLDVFVVRKLGVPGHSELAFGAIASGGVRVLTEDVIDWYRLSESDIEEVARTEAKELERRERAYRGRQPPIAIAGRIAILVDDGLATGATMRAAALAVRRLQPARVIVAAPVGAPDTCRALEEVADEVVCARTPSAFVAVGRWYDLFDQTSDDEVQRLMEASHGSINATRDA